MVIDSSAGLVEAVRQFRLLEPAQQATLERELLSRHAEARSLARELVQRGWLTPFQVNQLLQGRGQDLLLGSYVLLERLGEGGMGLVFKARNWKLGRVVALKLIRKDRLTNPNAVRRFRREVRAAAQLSHPNVVLAHDADEVAGTHFLVMEYVEGTDLSRLVKRDGPLAVEDACNYVWQAAQGLQHAFERGLVHRDIKPANLLLTSAGVVKVLDMGLARLAFAEEDGDASTTMTREGVVMGTPDYISPEQSRNSHTADIRADLYSLGCTLYYLLAGRPPFPKGTFTEKLLRHQLDEPPAIEQLRPEVPPRVGDVVRKLMAKQPEDRYQTPAEAADALSDAVNEVSGTSFNLQITESLQETSPLVVQRSALTAPAGRRSDESRPHWSAVVATPTEMASGPVPRHQSDARRLLWYNVAGVAALAGLAGLAIYLMRDHGSTKSETSAAAAKVVPLAESSEAAFERWVGRVSSLPAEQQVNEVSAKLKELNPGFDGVVTPMTQDGVVCRLDLLTDAVADLRPLRALSKLKTLLCPGNGVSGGIIKDLTPLKGLSLVELNIAHTQVSDLSSLKGMPLGILTCSLNLVSDLSPLKGMPLINLEISNLNAPDLSPLRGLPLDSLRCSASKITDLKPLASLPLTKLDCSSNDIIDLSPLKGMKLAILHCSNTRVSDLSTLKGMPLVDLSCNNTPLSDLSPLRGMKFESFSLSGTKVVDLSPLSDSKISDLRINSTQVSDLKPLKGIPLIHLYCHNTPVSDLTPLKGTSLQTLDISGTMVSDLSPLAGMPLTNLGCMGTKVTDLSPLKGFPLQFLTCDVRSEKDVAVLRSIKTLQKINTRPAGEFLTNWEQQAAFAAWLKTQSPEMRAWAERTAALPAEQQVKEVSAKLKELNPDFDGVITPTVQDGTVVGLFFYTDGVTDLRPLHALTKLQSLRCPGKGEGRPGLKNLSSLKGLALVELNISYVQVSDLSPLKGMPLRNLGCGVTLVSDLSPLKGMPLNILDISALDIPDLSPLRGLPLRGLGCISSKITDLKPFAGLGLNSLSCSHTGITDLSPLKGEKLTSFDCRFTLVSNLSPLRGMPLTVLRCSETAVSDLSPLVGMPLYDLDCSNTKVTDLSPLKNLPLHILECDYRPERDEQILRSIKTLERINGQPAEEFFSSNRKDARPR